MNDRHTRSAVLFLIVVVIAISAPALSQAEDTDAAVTNVTYAGDAVVDVESDGTVVWQQGPHQVAVSVSSDGGLDDGEACLWTGPGESGEDASESKLACQSLSVAAGETTTATVEFDAWPSNRTGDQVTRAVVRSADSERVLDDGSMTVTVLDRDGDLDEDGLSNEREVSAGTGLRVNDTDADGLEDGMEVHAFDTDPKVNDTDGDGLLDRAEIRTHQTDPTAPDTDSDGLPDGVEVSNGTSPNVADTDGDALDDALELNTYGTNATEPDTDGDGLDDGSEVRDHGTNPNNPDTDGDGLADNLEIHTYETDPNAIDTDGDGLQDGVEVTEYRTDPTDKDTDGDELSDGTEVNTHQTNPKKADTDGDGLDDHAEVNRFETDPLSSDTDGDGVSDPQEVDRSQLASPGLLRQLAVGGAIALLLVGVGIYRWGGSLIASLRTVTLGALGRATGESPKPRSTPAVDGDTDDGDPSTGREPPDPSAEPGVDEDAAGTNGTSSATEPATEIDQQETDGDVDFDVLPNAEVVMTVLEHNDGQIRQSKLVEETGWSKAKVSRVLSRMESDEEIVKVSVGRGNLITTPDDVPPGVRSPFED